MSEIGRILKFAVVGTIGFVINTAGLILGVRIGIRPSIAGPLGAEAAIVSNFILNNFWTFSDKSLTSWSVIPIKFIQFNILSLGSTIIQFVFLRVGEAIFGLSDFKKPFINYQPIRKIPMASLFAKLPVVPKISLYFIVYMISVGVGMVVNYIIYSQVIWRQG